MTNHPVLSLVGMTHDAAGLTGHLSIGVHTSLCGVVMNSPDLP